MTPTPSPTSTLPSAPAAPHAAAPPAAPLVPADAMEDLRLSAHDRCVLASCIAQRLGPAAWALGGFASAEVSIAVGRRRPRRPAVVVIVGAPPAAPVVRVPPRLVVELAPMCAPGEWLRLGAAEVWSIGLDGALVHRPDAPPRWVAAPGQLRSDDGLGLALPLAFGDVGGGDPIG